MERSAVIQRAVKWLLRSFAALGLLLVLLAATAVVLLATVDANRYRGALERFFANSTGRDIRIDGALEAHWISWRPRLIAEQVTIGNPPWMPAGTLAQIGRLTLVLELHPLHRLAFRRIEIENAVLHLIRDGHGHSNWQWSPPGDPNHSAPRLIHSLSMPHAHVDLEDVRRHLKFEGVVSVRDIPEGGFLGIDGKGQLNGRPVSLAINGDALAGVTETRPYRFTFDERSSGSRVSGRGFLARPFDFRRLETRFEAAGEDMKDLYFLVGISLPNTGLYRLTGKVARQGTQSRFTDLVATSGQSDLHGALSIDGSQNPSRIDAELHSERLRLSDLGERAAGRSRAPETLPRKLFSDVVVNLRGLRNGNAVIHYRGQNVQVGRIALHSVSTGVQISKGILETSSFSAALAEGALTGRLTIDATGNVPTESLDLRVTNLGLGQFNRKNAPTAPVDGRVQARVTLKGRGTSIHEFAASSVGTVTAVLPHGTIRASLAELAGLDLTRGLGLALGKKDAVTPVRCGVAGFQVRDGTMDAQSLVIDTEPVLITGKGRIQLDSEAIDLELRGRPKSFRLIRVRTPVSIGGTLSSPAFSIRARGVALQTGEAVALGVLLTPLASVLAFVDPGLAKDADCSALLQSAVQDGVKVSAVDRQAAADRQTADGQPASR